MVPTGTHNSSTYRKALNQRYPQLLKFTTPRPIRKRRTCRRTKIGTGNEYPTFTALSSWPRETSQYVNTPRLRSGQTSRPIPNSLIGRTALSALVIGFPFSKSTSFQPFCPPCEVGKCRL